MRCEKWLPARRWELRRAEERYISSKAKEDVQETKFINYLKKEGAFRISAEQGRANLSGGTLGSEPVPFHRAFAHRRAIIVVALRFVPAVRNSERLMPDIDADERLVDGETLQSRQDYNRGNSHH